MQSGPRHAAKKKPQVSPKQISQEKKELRAKRLRQLRIRRIIFRSVLSLLTILVLVLVAGLTAGYVAFRGPSQTMGDLVTVSMLETSALKFIPRIYYNEEQMEAILARNQVAESKAETDTSMIVIAPPTPAPVDAAELQTEEVTPRALAEDGIEVHEIKSSTYNGYMLVVYDPSRVICGVCRDEFSYKAGLQLKDLAKRYDAVAAINGGGFEDTGGVGNGGQPEGLVISEGKVRWTRGGGSNSVVIGFNDDDILIIGKMSAEEAQKRNIRDAMCFGPALVINGEPSSVKGVSSGLNPRTAIGQRADGAVLMLVIDGRQASSLGATYADLIKIMLEFEAVNAANLDGGSSSLMYYKGEYLNNGVVLTGSREMPTAFIVR